MLLAAALAALLSSCDRGEGGNTPAPASASADAVFAALSAPSWRIELPVAGFAPAAVALPLGATTPRPLVIAVHGRADRPEWQCGTWRGVVGGQAFILCPRGKPAPGERFSWSGAPDLGRELRAGLAALKQRFGGHVSSGPVVLVAHGLGAELAVDIVKQEPAFFSRVVLVEGGHEAWSATVAGVFARGRGDRVLFACGTQACEASAERAALFTSRAGSLSKAVAVEGGPDLAGPLLAALRRDWSWVVEGDPRFAKP